MNFRIDVVTAGKEQPGCICICMTHPKPKQPSYLLCESLGKMIPTPVRDYCTASLRLRLHNIKTRTVRVRSTAQSEFSKKCIALKETNLSREQ